MDSKAVENVFEANGYDFLYKKFTYQFYVSGLFDQIEDSRIIDCFLENYHFEENDHTLFDDFVFHFRIFHNLHVKNSLVRKDIYH
ncbi:hypothetical protein [Bacillus sp. CECT 9360]|uniref:hypothetical protein n=1 Tax=Bacillus sp. CECT 9360 TaxID=2845821 RepID=UPI001E63062D|nr:hypothetical protein [Bacillus sp. CECT 9360]CAH0347170.1 hypothetical protein BCI9360_03547 [Bacillus sp. CECT 9360]